MLVNYLVRIKVDSLNIRQQDSFSSKIMGKVKKGDIYTIVEESNGLGRLKSGAGWISLGTKYVEKLSDYIYDFGNCVITNYYKDDELGSGSIGALGTELIPNYSCASHNLPYGTKVYIEELKGVVNKDGIFEVHDTGGMGFDFDLFVTKSKSFKVGKKSLNVKVISWGTNKRIASSYTYIIEYYIRKQKETGINYLKRYHTAWESYKSMGGKLIFFWEFNDEDKYIRHKTWYEDL